MTEEMFNALMNYLEVYNEKDIEFYRHQLYEEHKCLTLSIYHTGEIMENWNE